MTQKDKTVIWTNKTLTYLYPQFSRRSLIIYDCVTPHMSQGGSSVASLCVSVYFWWMQAFFSQETEKNKKQKNTNDMTVE